MATTQSLPSFVELMASLGLSNEQDQHPAQRSSFGSSAPPSTPSSPPSSPPSLLHSSSPYPHSGYSTPGPSPSIVVSSAQAKDSQQRTERDRPPSFGRRSGARYAPYHSESRDIYMRRGSLPGTTSDSMRLDDDDDMSDRDGSTSPRLQDGSTSPRELTLRQRRLARRSERDLSACTPISTLVRNTTASQSHSPTATSFAHRRRGTSGPRTSPPPPLSIPSLPTLIVSVPQPLSAQTDPGVDIPRPRSVTSSSSNAFVSRRSHHSVSKSVSGATGTRISGYRRYPSPTEHGVCAPSPQLHVPVHAHT